MGYVINGEELETGDDGFLIDANYSDEAVAVIAEAENIKLTDEHWLVVNYMREQYKEHGQIQISATCARILTNQIPAQTGKNTSTVLFPMQPNRQSAKVAGLPKPFGKGGY